MSKAGWTGPSDTWDKHSRPHARAALDDARRAGWWLKKSSGTAKVWGVITCNDPALPPSQRCNLSIMSTSGSPDGSETAQWIHHSINSCPHDRTAKKEIEALAAAEELVAAATRCLEAAQSLIDARAHRDLVEDYLAQSEAAASEADMLLEQALAADRLAEEDEAAASEAVALAGASITLGPMGLAERARDQAVDAKGMVAGDASRSARLLKDRCDDIRNNARALLARLQ